MCSSMQRLSRERPLPLGYPSGRVTGSCREGAELADIVFVLIIVVFFVLCTLYVRGLDRS